MKHLYDDWDAVVGRAKGLWAPRWRTFSPDGVAAAPALDAAAIGAIAAEKNNIANDGDEDGSAGTQPTIEGTASVAAGAIAVGGVADDGRSLTDKGFDGNVVPAGKTMIDVGASGADAFSFTALDDKDEWGGRGTPSAPASAAGEIVAGSGGGDDAAGFAAGSGEAAALIAAGGGGDVGGRNSKGRWVRGAWSAVDVRAVQSRLSRIVDDTSARIRSNIVVKVGGMKWSGLERWRRAVFDTRKRLIRVEV